MKNVPSRHHISIWRFLKHSLCLLYGPFGIHVNKGIPIDQISVKSISNDLAMDGLSLYKVCSLRAGFKDNYIDVLVALHT
eukprot:c39802_g1_i1 orf=54-293(+)